MPPPQLRQRPAKFEQLLLLPGAFPVDPRHFVVLTVGIVVALLGAAELIAGQRSEILTPAPFMRPLQPGHMGNVYEMRIYTYRIGAMPEVLRRWAEAIPHREKYSPLAACWYSEIGDLNRFFHVWPYESLAERDRIRAEAAQDPHWPAPTGEFLVSMENKILVPAACSPLR